MSESKAAANEAILSIDRVGKVYAGGFRALGEISLDIRRGEMFALLGPNGAGKTTLISIICGLVTPSSGSIRVAGRDILSEFRHTRRLIGLVPQELHIDMFETVLDTVRFSRGLFGLPPNEAHIESLLKDLSLWDKRNDRLMTLSGGMKRRVLIAKALAHEPELLFLDEPTAGVDVELRRGMWELIGRLRQSGVTIVLTTHYIEEAEQMADRVGVINKGELIVVDETQALMRRLGQKRLTLHLTQALEQLPESLAGWDLELVNGGRSIRYSFHPEDSELRLPGLIRRVHEAGIELSDLDTRQSSLEEIFVDLVREP
ncbi:ABC transporter ATP-binding protein [Wenzhouxiangella marina]|uniref:Multidrug ABC transporter ATP-binding protein n=1 Tax=Wenzhouxiangella marina TaxID=1579979 RepID=A0A0K0XRV6_9GAMM|nr:ABC transporter ATP-binding protein [Wenzhouxiangella marina]AKS40444.1 multidrug ABC transporter ATP-binding protein [Wenzhouxiangella marina]MBB6088234.1 ABC-2 type transport system ATP-binding protein [Wenzhouxiangella marina]